MKEIKETCYKGTRILLGSDKRHMINNMIDYLEGQGFKEISIPIIQSQEMFFNKVGEENIHMMYNFTDMKGRSLCLAPEYTSIVQQLAHGTFKHQKDVKLFYVQECFRGEKPQAGRYRQFTQLGVEILNPTQDFMGELANLAFDLINIFTVVNTEEIVLKMDVARGLDYYKEGKGFEISIASLGAQKQVCGGGEYDHGLGFAIGIDRLLTLKS